MYYNRDLFVTRRPSYTAWKMPELRHVTKNHDCIVPLEVPRRLAFEERHLASVDRSNDMSRK